ncbi:MAG: hypothetical protein E2O53_00245 [Gammaproteobacteria bacterium]|nr:MAG: hypothetical protein E2O53_00245 [Gammaproteobacteria bacterium]
MIRKLAGLFLLTPFLSARADIADLRWMAGCWSQDGRESGSVEQWTAPAGGTILGMSRIVSGGKTVAFEFLRIVEEEDGWIRLVASPSGQETARFKLVSMSTNEVIFENPDHDFPQRIIYRLDSDSNLVGRIEREVNGTERTADFPMTRTKCGSEDESE